jgi:hypothetical protein
VDVSGFEKASVRGGQNIEGNLSRTSIAMDSDNSSASEKLSKAGSFSHVELKDMAAKVLLEL